MGSSFLKVQPTQRVLQLVFVHLQAPAAAPAQAPARPGYGVQMPQLTEEQQKRQMALMQQRFGGNPELMNSVGAKLLGKMGFGAAEDSKGGLGRNEHVSAVWPLSRQGCSAVAVIRCCWRSAAIHSCWTSAAWHASMMIPRMAADWAASSSV